MVKIKPQPGIMDIKLYQGGASHVDGVADVLKLSSNENPFGTSPLVKDAIVKAAQNIHLYPSSEHGALRSAIAQKHDLDENRIICGAGSDEILTFICQVFAGVGDEVIHTQHGFGMYRIVAQAAGATPIEVAEKNRVVDVDAILAACTPRTRVIFIANPANPTGTMAKDKALEKLIKAMPKKAILVLDGAYAEYVDGFDGGAAWVHEHDNVVMTRTFSKLYGLGGMRIGWGYASQHIIDVLNRVRGPFNLSQPAIEAAIAALADDEFTQKCIEENAKWRVWLKDELAKIGLGSDASSANFVLARFGSKKQAAGCYEYLRSQGVLVRPVASYQLPKCLRITVADEAGCRQLIHHIKQFKEMGK